MYTDEEIKALLDQTGFAVTDPMLDKLKTFYEILKEKNKVMNLTAITEYDDVIVKHFADSLLIGTIIPFLDQNKDNGICEFSRADIIDVGSGAGFPGIPLKICAEDIRMTLIDSLNKRVGFLNEAIDRLKLKEISAVHGRCEDAGQDGAFRERFDYAISRAVADLRVLCEYCLPFVKPGGFFIAYKSANSDEEIKSAEKAAEYLGGSIIKNRTCQLPGTDIDRNFVIIKKNRSTPKKYPRKAGIPSKQPLC